MSGEYRVNPNSQEDWEKEQECQDYKEYVEEQMRLWLDGLKFPQREWPANTPRQEWADPNTSWNYSSGSVAGWVPGRSAVDKIGGFLFPNITAFGQRGVRGTFADNLVGGLKAAYNAAQGIATLTSPSLMISGQQLEIADAELGGASIIEAGTAVFGLASVSRNIGTKGASAYSVAFETAIPKVGIGSRPSHFAAANRILQRMMAEDSSFAAVMERLGIRIPSRLGESPAGWSWHHVPDRPGVMQLVPRDQHGGKIWQWLLHPGRKGGFILWGADY